MVARKLLLPGDAAKEIGVTYSKLDRLRKLGLIPEVVPAGRYFFFPADQLASIRQRLIEAGRINPARELPLVPAQIGDRAGVLTTSAAS